MSQFKGGYRSALKFIYDREHFGIKLGLENITNFLKVIGSPQTRFPAIHIAGTNGKGSTASYLESILRQAGYKTGIFTSPHLFDFRERIRINGRKIDRQYVSDFIASYGKIIEDNGITFFELCTALAFSLFAEKKVDIAVTEVGLGGRLDATSTVQPILSIITDISFDHTNILGNTLKKIAFEKAGIIKSRVPVLVGLMKREPRDEIIRVGSEKGAPMEFLSRKSFSRDGALFNFNYHNSEFNLNCLRSPLPGKHQILNAALSIRAIELLRRHGYTISETDIREGIKATEWPGRFQKLRSASGRRFILDVGHNPSGIRAVVECFKEVYPGRKADLIAGFVKNKNLDKSIAHLRPLARRIEVVRLNTYRTTDPNEVASYFGTRRPISISDSVIKSAHRLMESARPKDIILVVGSHFLVGDFLANRRRILGW